MTDVPTEELITGDPGEGSVPGDPKEDSITEDSIKRNLFFFSIIATKIHYTHKHWHNNENKND